MSYCFIKLSKNWSGPVKVKEASVISNIGWAVRGETNSKEQNDSQKCFWPELIRRCRACLEISDFIQEGKGFS